MSEITRDQLMAYLDGQLDDGSRAAVEAHLATHPQSAAEIAGLERQSAAIRALFGPALSEPLPARLDPHRLALARNRRRWQSLTRAAMMVGLLGIGMLVGWSLRPSAPGPEAYSRLIADAVSAHTVYVAENRHAVEVAATDADHLTNWLSNRLETELAMPDLATAGFSFMGGRLLPAPALPGGRAAQLMYENGNGERVTLYITPSAGVDGPARELVQLGADTALYWANAAITCTIVAPQTPESVEMLASSIFAQLSPSTGPSPYREL